MTTDMPGTAAAPAESDSATASGASVAKYTVVALGVLIAAAGLVATFLPRETRDIDWQLVAVDLTRADQVTVTFDVEKAPLASAECQIAAHKDAAVSDQRRSWRLDGVVVGPRSDGARVSRHTVVVPTDEKADRAAIAQCVITRDH